MVVQCCWSGCLLVAFCTALTVHGGMCDGAYLPHALTDVQSCAQGFDDETGEPKQPVEIESWPYHELLLENVSCACIWGFVTWAVMLHREYTKYRA